MRSYKIIAITQVRTIHEAIGETDDEARKACLIKYENSIRQLDVIKKEFIFEAYSEAWKRSYEKETL